MQCKHILCNLCLKKKKKAIKSTPLHCTKYTSEFIKCCQEIVMETQNYIPWSVYISLLSVLHLMVAPFCQYSQSLFSLYSLGLTENLTSWCFPGFVCHGLQVLWHPLTRQIRNFLTLIRAFFSFHGPIYYLVETWGIKKI